MSTTWELFSEIDNNITTPVQLGNGEIVESKGTCNISIQTKEGMSQIYNRLLVPSLRLNLLSLGQLLENGYKLDFDNNLCTIYDMRDKSQVFTTVEMINRCFPLNIRYADVYVLHISPIWIIFKTLASKTRSMSTTEALKFFSTRTCCISFHTLKIIMLYVKFVYLARNIDNYFLKVFLGDKKGSWN